MDPRRRRNLMLLSCTFLIQMSGWWHFLLEAQQRVSDFQFAPMSDNDSGLVHFIHLVLDLQFCYIDQLVWMHVCMTYLLIK